MLFLVRQLTQTDTFRPRNVGCFYPLQFFMCSFLLGKLSSADTAFVSVFGYGVVIVISR